MHKQSLPGPLHQTVFIIIETSALNVSFHTSGSSAQPATKVLLDKYKLTTSQVDCEIQQKDVPYLAAYFDNVELYVDAMELTPGEQTDVNRKPNTHIAMIECLRLWKAKKPEQATFRTLLEMLVKLRKEEIAVKVCQYLEVSLRIYTCLRFNNPILRAPLLFTDLRFSLHAGSKTYNHSFVEFRDPEGFTQLAYNSV